MRQPVYYCVAFSGTVFLNRASAWPLVRSPQGSVGALQGEDNDSFTALHPGSGGTLLKPFDLTKDDCWGCASETWKIVGEVDQGGGLSGSKPEGVCL